MTDKNNIWHICKPGNMPEDILPESYAKTDEKGRKYYDYIVVSEDPEHFPSIKELKTYNYRIRIQRKNKKGFSWQGLHPYSWRLSSLEEYKKVKNNTL